MKLLFSLGLVALLGGCGVALDFDPADDLGTGAHDAAMADAVALDGGGVDQGSALDAGGAVDAGSAVDAGNVVEGGRADATMPPLDGGAVEAGASDAGRGDLGFVVGDATVGDAMLTCSTDTACNDFNSCTTESCDFGTCVYVPVVCDDGNACTGDFCSPSMGCIARRIDVDGDGHSPSSLGGCGDDCDDSNPLVFGGQSTWFTTPHAAGAAMSFDYNCNGSIELEFPHVALPSCIFLAPGTMGCSMSGGCCAGDGWFGVSVPAACGVTARYQVCRALTGSCMAVTDTMVTQACH